jgi:hypothetical protein
MVISQHVSLVKWFGTSALLAKKLAKQHIYKIFGTKTKSLTRCQVHEMASWQNDRKAKC